MKRRNLMLDEDTVEAARYLALQHRHTNMSAAIRHAVQEQARRKGWKPSRTQPLLPAVPAP